MYGPPLCRKRKVMSQGWSAQMYTAFIGVNHSWPGWNALRSLPPLVIQSRETASGYGFGERRVRPLCHLLIRQQTWQETIISVGIAKLQLHQPTPGADMVHSSRARPTPYVPSYSLGPLRPRCGGCAR